MQVKIVVNTKRDKRTDHTVEFCVGEVFDNKGYLVKSALERRLDRAIAGFVDGRGESKKKK